MSVKLYSLLSFIDAPAVLNTTRFVPEQLAMQAHTYKLEIR